MIYIAPVLEESGCVEQYTLHYNVLNLVQNLLIMWLPSSGTDHFFIKGFPWPSWLSIICSRQPPAIKLSSHTARINHFCYVLSTYLLILPDAVWEFTCFLQVHSYFHQCFTIPSILHTALPMPLIQSNFWNCLLQCFNHDDDDDLWWRWLKMMTIDTMPLINVCTIIFNTK